MPKIKNFGKITPLFLGAAHTMDMLPKRFWLGLKWRAILATGLVSMMLFTSLLWYGSIRIAEVENEQLAEERERSIYLLNSLLNAWSVGNGRFLYSTASSWIEKIDRPKASDYQLLADAILDRSMFGYEAVWSYIYADNQCIHASHDDWLWHNPCEREKPDQTVICGQTGCCKVTSIDKWDGKFQRVAACFDVSTAFIGRSRDERIKVIDKAAGVSTNRDGVLIGEEIGFPPGSFVSIKSDTKKGSYERLIVELFVYGGLAIMASLWVLFVTLYSRINKIKYILTGFASIGVGNRSQLAKAMNEVKHGLLHDEVDLLASALMEVGDKLDALRAKELKALTERAEREAFVVHARERDLLLDQLSRAVEEDKATIARELHDEFGQNVVSIRVDASSIARMYPDDSALMARAERIGVSCEKLSKSIRYIIDDLRPPAIDTHGLCESIHALAREWEQRLEGRTVFQLELDAEIDQMSIAMQSICYRIVQESITNIAKYAHANKVIIRLSIEHSGNGKSNYISVYIEDNGAGFDVLKRRNGRGVDGMRERAMALGGEFVIDSAPGQGVRVWCRFPASGPGGDRNQ